MALSLAAEARTPEEKKALLEAQSSCQNVVRFDEDNLYLGYGPYLQWGETNGRMPNPATLEIVNFDGVKTSLTTADSVIDLVRDEGHLFILTFSGIEEWDMSTKTRIAIHATTPTVTNEYKSHAEAWTRYNDTMVIAHGSQGVTFFDLKTKTITGKVELLQSQLPLESMATAVSIIGSTAYFAMDNLTLVNDPPFPFRGIVAMNLETRTVIKELPGLDPGVDASAAAGNKLIVSFGGQPVLKFDVTKFGSDKLPNPQSRLFRYPVPGHPIGSAAIDDKYYYSCYSYHDLTNMQTYQKPIVLNRKALLLD